MGKERIDTMLEVEIVKHGLGWYFGGSEKAICPECGSDQVIMLTRHSVDQIIVICNACKCRWKQTRKDAE
jgi:hypothetical protein